MAFGCSSSDPAPAPATDSGPGGDTSSAVTVQVGQGGTVFVPATVTIKPGQTVNWVWAGSGHSVTSGNSETCTADGMFDSKVLATGATFSQTFPTAGTFNYFCTPHCSFGMKGSVIVAP